MGKAGPVIPALSAPQGSRCRTRSPLDGAGGSDTPPAPSSPGRQPGGWGRPPCKVNPRLGLARMQGCNAFSELRLPRCSVGVPWAGGQAPARGCCHQTHQQQPKRQFQAPLSGPFLTERGVTLSGGPYSVTGQSRTSLCPKWLGLLSPSFVFCFPQSRECLDFQASKKVEAG